MNSILLKAGVAILGLLSIAPTMNAQKQTVPYMASQQSSSTAEFRRNIQQMNEIGSSVTIPAAKARFLKPAPGSNPNHKATHNRKPAALSNPVAKDDSGSRRVIKASLWSSNAWIDATEWGMYSMPASGGPLTLLTDPTKYTAMDYVANGGGTLFGENHYFMVSYTYNQTPAGLDVTAVMNAVLDANSWEALNSKLQTTSDGLPSIASISTAMASDPKTNIIYGTFYGHDDTKFTYGTYDSSKYTLIPIALIDEPWAACAFDVNGDFYSLHTDGSLCKVEKQTGAETVIGNTGIREIYSSTGNINPDDNMFYYIQVADTKSTLYKIDLATAKSTLVYEFPHGENFYGMYFDMPSGTDFAPKAPTDLSAVFAGQLIGKVNFTMPAENMTGGTLNGDLTWEVNVNYQLVKSGNAAPGANVEVDIEVPEKGSYLIEVRCSNDNGTSSTARVNAQAGDIPALPHQPTNLSFTEDFENWGRTYLSWTAPTHDVNEKPIDPADVVYYISDRLLTKRYYEIPGTSIIHDLGDCSEMQKFESLTVQSGTLINGSYQYNWTETVPNSNLLSVGHPYPLPFSEPISTLDFRYEWVMTASPQWGHWNFYDEVSTSTYTIKPYNNDSGMVLFQAERDNAISEIRSGKIDLGNAEHPAVILYLYKRAWLNELLGVTAMEANKPETGVLLGTFSNHVDTNDEAGWYEVRVPLDQFKGKTIQLVLMAGCPLEGHYVAIDAIEVRNLVENDLAINNFSTPAQLLPGQRVSFGVTVHNWGFHTSDEYTVTLYQNGKAIEEKKFNALPSGEDCTMVFNHLPTPLFDSKNEYYVEVTTNDDDDLSNNISKTVSLDLVQYNHPEPLELTGESDEKGVLLTWEEPNLQPEEAITDGFDTYPAYVIQNFGDWITYDGDGYDTYYINGLGTSYYPNAAVPQAWQVWSNIFFAPETVFPIRSGAQCAISFTSGGENNDWLISPMLSGNAQKISFYATGADIIAASQDDADHESFEVLYSTGSTNPADFISVGTRTNINNFWMKYNFNLPEGAKRFAIRHLGSYDDSFALLVDDVTYECAGFDDLTLVGFNVYRNGTKLNDELIGEMEYFDATVPSGTHTYHVTAVYEEGESKASAPYIHQISGVEIVNSDADFETTDVYNLQGIRVACGSQIKSLPTGIYIIRGKKVYINN